MGNLNNKKNSIRNVFFLHRCDTAPLAIWRRGVAKCRNVEMMSEGNVYSLPLVGPTAKIKLLLRKIIARLWRQVEALSESSRTHTHTQSHKCRAAAKKTEPKCVYGKIHLVFSIQWGMKDDDEQHEKKKCGTRTIFVTMCFNSNNKNESWTWVLDGDVFISTVVKLSVLISCMRRGALSVLRAGRATFVPLNNFEWAFDLPFAMPQYVWPQCAKHFY